LIKPDNSGCRRNQLVLTLVGGGFLALLTSCDQGERASYPPTVQALLQVSYPADGQFHIQQKGDFAITPETFLCRPWKGWGLDPLEIKRAIAARAQSDRLNGELRTDGIFGKQSSPGCRGSLSSGAIFADGRIAPKRRNVPYKITLVVWQRDAAWVGVIERPDGLRSDAVPGPIAPNDGPTTITRADLERESRMDASRQMDIADLSRKFFSSVKR